MTSPLCRRWLVRTRTSPAPETNDGDDDGDDDGDLTMTTTSTTRRSTRPTEGGNDRAMRTMDREIIRKTNVGGRNVTPREMITDERSTGRRPRHLVDDETHLLLRLHLHLHLLLLGAKDIIIYVHQRIEIISRVAEHIQKVFALYPRSLIGDGLYPLFERVIVSPNVDCNLHKAP